MSLLTRLTASLERLARDLRFASRLFTRTPGVHVAIVATLGLGIGATTATFAVVDGVLLRPLPYADADRLVVVLHHGTDPVSPANFTDWRRRTEAFSTMGAAEFWTPSLTAAGGAERIYGLRVTPELLADLGVHTIAGRMLRSGADSVQEVVIGHGLWLRAFGGDAAVVGSDVSLDGARYRVAGIMPADFAFAPFWATRAEIWAPLDLSARGRDRQANSLRVFARLGPGVSLSRARASIAAVTAALERDHPGTNRDVVVRPLKDMVVGHVRTPMLLLFGAVGLVLVVACANVAHLLLARSNARRREMAVRAALGAGRGRMAGQLLAESAMLAIAGGLAGTLIAALSLDAVRRLAALSLPRVQDIQLDARVWAFTLIVSSVTAIVFGIVPALRLCRQELTSALKDADRGATTSRRSRLARTALIVSEIACAVVLLTAAGLLVRSFVELRTVDPGFRPETVLTFSVAVTGTAEAAPDRRMHFYQRVATAVAALPGVDAVSAINHVPLAGDMWRLPFEIDGAPALPAGEQQNATYRVVLPGYFDTMRVRLVAGRDLTAADRADAAPVIIVNEALARTHWPGQDPIGKRIRVRDVAGADWRTVVGVAAHVVRQTWRDDPAAEVYLPLLQNAQHRESRAPHWSSLSFVVRTSGDPAAVAPAARRAVHAIAPHVPVSDVLSMGDVARDATLADRFMMTLLAAFAGVALVLAAVGIYGVMSFLVDTRRHEIGIRLALGAEPARVERSFVAHAIGIVGAGAGLGLGGVLLLRETLAALLYNVAPVDWPTYGAVIAVLGSAALVAAWLPARRAARIDARAVLR